MSKKYRTKEKRIKINVDFPFLEFSFPVVGVSAMQPPMALAYSLSHPYEYKDLNKL
jgi:hypothetical protein